MKEALIVINNSFSELKRFDPKVLEILKEKLTYTDDTVLYELNNAKFKLQVAIYRRNHRLAWFFKKKIGELENSTQVCLLQGNKFPTGLFSIVLEVLDSEGVSFGVQDKRRRPERLLDLPWIEPSYAGRYYQEEMVKLGVEAGRGVFVAAVGSGKTYVLQRLIKELDVPTLVITPSTDLKEQTFDSLKEVFGPKSVDKITSKIPKEGYKPVRVANIQTLAAHQKKGNLAKILKDVEMVCIDEFHHVGASSYTNMLAELDKVYHRFGFSVSGEEYVQIKDSKGVKVIKIKDLCETLSSNEVRNIQSEEIEIIGWDEKDKCFDWFPLTHLHKYCFDKPMFELSTQYGGKVILTDDHSVMRVKKTTKTYIQNSPVFDFELEAVETKDIKIGDLVLKHSTAPKIKEESFKIELLNIIPHENIFTLTDKETINSMPLNPKDKYRFKNSGVHGPYIPFNLNEGLGNELFIYHSQGGKGLQRFRREVVFDENMSWFYGFFLGDGCIIQSLKKIAVFPHEDELELVLENIEKLKTYFPDIKTRTLHTGTKCKEVHILCKPLYFLIKHLCGLNKAKNKKFNGFEFSLPNKSKKALLEGLIQSDGYCTKKKAFVYSTSSEQLGQDISFFLKTLGYIGQIYESSSNSPSDRKKFSKSYKVCWGDRINKRMNKYNSVVRHNKTYLPVRITNLKALGKTHKTVYDLTVGDGKTFLANDVLVHNTGTFLRNDSKTLDMYGVLSDVLYKYTASKAIKEGFLTPLEVKIYDIRGKKGSNFQTEYKRNYCGNHELLAKIADIVAAASDEAKQVLILVKQKDAAGKIIHGYLEEHGIESEYISGDDKKEKIKKVLKDFNEKTVKVLVGSTILGEGIDIRSTDHLIMAQGGKSEIAITQATGRAVRLFPGKEVATLHDFNFEGTKYMQKHLLERIKIYEKNFGADIEVL